MCCTHAPTHPNDTKRTRQVCHDVVDYDQGCGQQEPDDALKQQAHKEGGGHEDDLRRLEGREEEEEVEDGDVGKDGTLYVAAGRGGVLAGMVVGKEWQEIWVLFGVPGKAGAQKLYDSFV